MHTVNWNIVLQGLRKVKITYLRLERSHGHVLALKINPVLIPFNSKKANGKATNKNSAHTS